MTIDFFNNLTPEKILDAAETAGGRATGRIFQLNSLENRVYEIEMEDGESVVGKFYRQGRWSKEAILDEHEFLADLKAQEVPVVAPLPLKGAPHPTLGHFEGGSYYAIFPKVRGRAPDELNDDQARQLGRLVARMHNVGETKKAKHRVLMNPENFGLKPLELLLSGGWIAMELQSKYEKTVRDLIEAITPLFSGIKTHRLHGDCHLGNLLFDGPSAFFLDFDDMVEGPAVQDIWLATNVGAGERNTLRDFFIEGYETMRPFDRQTLHLVEPLRALRIINYSAWIAKRWEDPFFKKIFTEFQTYTYWAQELEGLERISRNL